MDEKEAREIVQKASALLDTLYGMAERNAATVSRLTEENSKLLERIEGKNVDATFLKADVERLTEENARLREALEDFAWPAGWYGEKEIHPDDEPLSMAGIESGLTVGNLRRAAALVKGEA